MTRDFPGGRLRNPGGTRGGMGEFLFGVALLVAGGYLFMDNVVVSSPRAWGWGWGWGSGWRGSFGITLVPLFLGIVLLFINGKSRPGWLLTIGSVIAIFVGIVASLSVHWRPTSLYYTLVIIALIAGGIGLIARSLKEH